MHGSAGVQTIFPTYGQNTSDSSLDSTPSVHGRTSQVNKLQRSFRCPCSMVTANERGLLISFSLEQEKKTLFQSSCISNSLIVALFVRAIEVRYRHKNNGQSGWLPRRRSGITQYPKKKNDKALSRPFAGDKGTRR
jgi:hypothetical protein